MLAGPLSLNKQPDRLKGKLLLLLRRLFRLRSNYLSKPIPNLNHRLESLVAVGEQIVVKLDGVFLDQHHD